jgi:hypothetical protein
MCAGCAPRYIWIKIKIMKTELVNPQLQNGYLRIALLLLIVWLALHLGFGQAGKMNDHDYLMPQKGKTMVEFYTGSPYVAIGQYTYGVSNRFAVGVIYGYTPFVKAYGIRIKAVLAQSADNFRINFKAPLFYYPHTEPKDDEPWVAAWPALNCEWKLNNETRIWAGFGIMGAVCLDYLLGDENDKKKMPGGEASMPVKEGMLRIYNTFQVGVSKPISDKMSFVFEAAPVMQGLNIKSQDGFLDVIPVVVTTGLTYSF